MTTLDLPPERRECQKLKEHTICLANCPGRNACFFRQLIADSLLHLIIPQAEEEAEESNPYMDPEEALEVILDERLPELHKMARELLRDQLISIYYLEKCPLYTSLMNTAERLHRSSHLSVPLAITEAIRLYKQELNKALVNRKPKNKAKMMSPLTPETGMIQGPNEPYQKTKTAKMEDVSESE